MDEGRIYPTFVEVTEPFFRKDGKPKSKALMNREEVFHHTGRYTLSDNPIIRQYQLDRTQQQLEKLWRICKDQHIFFVRVKKKKQACNYGFTHSEDDIENNLNRVRVRQEKAQKLLKEVEGMTPVRLSSTSNRPSGGTKRIWT